MSRCSSMWLRGERGVLRFALGPFFIALLFRQRLWGIGIAFPRFDGCGIECDMSDEAVVLGLCDERFMQPLRQLAVCKFFESTREGGLVRQLPHPVPATQFQQLAITA